MMELTGKTALVTGTSSGLGKAIALRFLAEGANVFGCGRRPESDIANPGYRYVSGDVADYAQAENIVRGCAEAFGGIDILVNCAGVTGIGNVFDTPPEDFHRQFQVNVFGPFHMSKAALPELQKRQGSTIINIGSELGAKAKADRIAYCPSKAAVEMLTRCLAIECGPEIRVNGVLPGLMDTPMTAHRFDRMPDPAEAREKAGKSYVLKRLCRVEDVVEAVVFLASEKSSFITGDMIAVCGGGQFTTCNEE